MNEEQWDRVVKYTELQGTSGQENLVRAAFREDLTPLVDEVVQNGLGGLYGLIKHHDSNAPRVMFGAHFDEVGFIVKRITPRGLLEVKALGGWNQTVVSAQRFTLFTRHHEYPVVSSSVAPHLLRGQSGEPKVPTLDQILFDGGFTSDAQAEEFGVHPGDFIVPDVKTVRMANPNRVVSKSWDNRFGIVTILDVLERLQNQTIPNTLMMGANVQEEVGLRGVGPAVHQLQPDLFFGLDSSTADDLTTAIGQGQLDHGAILRVVDPGVIMPRRLKEFILDMASDERIPLQYFVPNGGTDAAGAQSQNNGIPAVTLGVASRYIHTHQTVWSISDFQAAEQLVEKLILNLNASTVNDIIYGD